MTKSGTMSDNEWYNEWYNEWQRLKTNDNEWLFRPILFSLREGNLVIGTLKRTL